MADNILFLLRRILNSRNTTLKGYVKGVIEEAARELDREGAVVQPNLRVVDESEPAKVNAEFIAAILQNPKASIFLKDLNGRYILVNDKFLTDWNRTASEIIGRTPREIFPENVADYFEQSDQAVISEGFESFEYTIWLPLSTLSFSTDKYLVNDSAGNPWAICGVCRESERKIDVVSKRIGTITAVFLIAMFGVWMLPATTADVPVRDAFHSDAGKAVRVLNEDPAWNATTEPEWGPFHGHRIKGPYLLYEGDDHFQWLELESIPYDSPAFGHEPFGYQPGSLIPGASGNSIIDSPSPSTSRNLPEHTGALKRKHGLTA